MEGNRKTKSLFIIFKKVVKDLEGSYEHVIWSEQKEKNSAFLNWSSLTFLLISPSKAMCSALKNTASACK